MANLQYVQARNLLQVDATLIGRVPVLVMAKDVTTLCSVNAMERLLEEIRVKYWNNRYKVVHARAD